MGLWKYQESNLTLNLTVRPWYEIDLERCNTSAQVLDWIIQIAKKRWATPEIIADLAKILDRCLDIQKNICSTGVNRKFNAKKWLLSDAGHLHRYLTDEMLNEYLKKRAKGKPFVTAEDLMFARQDALVDMKR